MPFLTIAQVIVSVILIVLILIQERSSGVSGILGGGDSGGFYQARRGLEKTIFVSTIIAMIVFVALSLLNLIL